jgi:mono/diheme cytochrome c family protein
MRRSQCVLFAAALFVLGAIPSAAADKGAQLFQEKCSACHSIGGGELAGPDLIVTQQMPPGDLRAAIHRMEENVGTLHVEEVEALVSLLKNPAAKDLLAATGAEQNATPTAVVEPGDATIGRQLFFGERPFQNAGTPCFGCHATGGRGGSLAVDLTLTYARVGRAGLVATTLQPVFPLMKSAYANHAITQEEADHVSAFLKESAATAKPGPQPGENAGAVHRTAAGVAAIVVAGAGLVLRSRRAGARSRMVRNTTGRGGRS